MIKQTLVMLAAVMGAVLILFSFCLTTAEAIEIPDYGALPPIRARVTVPSPLAEGDLLAAIDALIGAYPEAFEGTVRPAMGARAVPHIASRAGDTLELTFEALPHAPLTDLATVRVDVWDADGLLANLPLSGTIELEGQRLVAAREIPRGAALSAEDIALTWVPLRGQAGQVGLIDAAPLVGMTTSRPLLAGQLLDIRTLQEPMLVKRGATVRLLVTRGNLMLETTVEALQSGSRGALIAMRNPSTGAKVIARVTGLNQAVVD